MSFPERLLESLKQVGIKRHGAGAWLAQKTGTTVKAANKWLNGESLPLREKVQVIAQATGTNIEWLEYGRGEMRSKTYISEKEGIYELDLAHLDTWNSSAPLELNEVEVALLNEADLSTGKTVADLLSMATQKLRFNLTCLNKAGVSVNQVACCNVSGDSMAPVLPSGTVVAIDTSQVDIIDGKIYAIEHGGMLRIKYLYRLPFNGLRIRSANADLQDEELNADTAEKVRVLGRVFWYSVLL